MKKKKSIAKYFIALFLALFIVYSIGAFYYSSHFSHNTIINGINVGGMSPKAAARAVADHAKEYRLQLIEAEDTEIIKGEDIELTLDMTNDVNDLFKKYNPFMWPKNLFAKEKASVTGHVSYDEDLLSKEVDHLHCFDDMQKPKNAYIKLQENKYVIVPEEEGTVIDKKECKLAIANAIKSFQNELDFKEANLYEKAKIDKNNEKIVKACNDANLYAKTKITYMPETKETVLDFSTFSDWIILKKDFSIVFDKEMIGDYVETLASKFDNKEGTVQFKTHDGDTKEFNNGAFVWEIDQKKEAEAIINNLKNGQEVSREPVYSKKGSVAIGSGIGPNYVEVSLVQNHVWIYKDGYVLSESPVKVGSISSGIFTAQKENNNKICFNEEVGFVISKENDSTESTESTNQSEDGWNVTENDDGTTFYTPSNTPSSNPNVVSNNVECSDAFYKNIKDNVKEGTIVVVY